jgi:hypothetical protein
MSLEVAKRTSVRAAGRLLVIGWRSHDRIVSLNDRLCLTTLGVLTRATLLIALVAIASLDCLLALFRRSAACGHPQALLGQVSAG